MADKTNQSSNSSKKGRLGRGLGSLLGGGSEGGGLDVTGTSATSVVNSATAVQPTASTAAPSVTTVLPHAQVSAVTSATTATSASTASSVASKPALEMDTQSLTSQKSRVLTQHLPTQNVADQKKTSSSSAVTPGQSKPIAATAKPASSSPASAPAATHPVPTQAAQTTQPKSEATQPISTRPVTDENQVWTIAIDKLKPNTQQPRQIFTPEALRDLTASVKEKGILMPIVARCLNEREFEIIAGERRWRAAQAAGLHEVPVILRKVSEQDSLELAIIENIQRENLNPLEEAEAYDRLITDYSLTQQQVADKLGKERPSIANSLRLLMLPKEVKELLQRNEISAGHAKVLLGVVNPQKQIAIARQVAAEKLSVRATEKLVAKAKTDAREGVPETKADSNANLSKRMVEGLATELQKLIGTKVVIDYADSKGKLNIHFYTDDQLNHVVEKIRKAWEK